MWDYTSMPCIMINKKCHDTFVHFNTGQCYFSWSYQIWTNFIKWNDPNRVQIPQIVLICNTSIGQQDNWVHGFLDCKIICTWQIEKMIQSMWHARVLLLPLAICNRVHSWTNSLTLMLMNAVMDWLMTLWQYKFLVCLVWGHHFWLNKAKGYVTVYIQSTQIWWSCILALAFWTMSRHPVFVRPSATFIHLPTENKTVQLYRTWTQLS